ncbi:hypothetical protein BJX68DRAFT_279840 [Aspergillus pseudodeflectus]|uniref:Zn(2)-C6 fungal-type domain-containing protein n=1 Tax=Aspergillus pseudodeflectus TaxID=176178 RepID=A0ABR4JED4_9EURO
MPSTFLKYSTSRQKACRQCSAAKARCQRRPDNVHCARCAQRGVPCSYAFYQASRQSEHQSLDHAGAIPASPFSMTELSFPSPERLPETTEDLDFSTLNLMCPINAEDIQNRWIQTYIPVPGQTVKNYPKGVAKFIYRTLRSYAASAVHGRGILPFIHPRQLAGRQADSPLTTCLSLVRVSANQIPGSQHATAGILQREMHAVYESRSMYNPKALFAAFQAYLIYAMVLFFQLSQDSDRQFRDIVTKLQELACASARDGLICAADQQRVRPRWEEWIVAEAKRRTLYVMYLFDSILATEEGLPTFLGVELHGLPAPANKLLWQAGSRYEWEREYNIHLAHWMEGSLTIDELWPRPAYFNESDVARRGARVDRWLENLDEYGTMLYAIMQCTHG